MIFFKSRQGWSGDAGRPAAFRLASGMNLRRRWWPEPFISAMLLFGVPISGGTEELLPSGWRIASESVAPAIEADLNSDGLPDKALLVTNGDLTALVLFLSTKHGVDARTLFTTRHEPSTLSIGLLPEGKYRTGCGKGYMDCRKGEPDVLSVRRPTLVYRDENVEVAFLTKGTTVRKIWLSD